MEVKCNCCGENFEVDTRKYNLYNKNGWNFYCKSCGNRGRKKRIKHICSNCGREFERIPSAKVSKSGNYFCCQSCATSYNNSHYRVGENNPNWIDGSNKGSMYIKVAFRTYKHRCAICGLNEECCLEVHHIDENRRNADVNNLIILCANCHARVHRGGLKITEEIKKNRVVG